MNLDCNRIIFLFINLEIIREEDKENIYIYIYFLNLTKFLQFDEVTSHNYEF